MQASFEDREDREDDELVEPLFAALRKDVGGGSSPSAAAIPGPRVRARDPGGRPDLVLGFLAMGPSLVRRAQNVSRILP